MPVTVTIATINATMSGELKCIMHVIVGNIDEFQFGNLVTLETNQILPFYK